MADNLSRPLPDEPLLFSAAGVSNNNDEQAALRFQQGPFFNTLNRDVRLVIYDHLYVWLPPLIHKFCFDTPVEDDCRGMVLSCKLANIELSQAAARHLKKFFDGFVVDFEKQQGVPIKLASTIPIYDGWHALKTVTLSLDISFFAEALAKYEIDGENHGFDSDLGADYGWSRPITPWRELLQWPFQKVTVLIADSAQARISSEEEQLIKHRKIRMILRGTLRELCESICGNSMAYQLEMDRDAFYWEKHPPRFHINKYEKYDPTPKRKWYSSAEESRFARVQHTRMNNGGRQMAEYLILRPNQPMAEHPHQASLLCMELSSP
jgi:hypothetical protein